MEDDTFLNFVIQFDGFGMQTCKVEYFMTHGRILYWLDGPPNAINGSCNVTAGMKP